VLTTVIFDFDGTLVDSDAALLAPFEALGVDPDDVPLGLPAEAACRLAGITLDDYLAAYDPDLIQPFDGIDDLLSRLPTWALCSNKVGWTGRHELARLGWSPVEARFTEDFGGRPKTLAPVLTHLDLPPEEALFVGDTEHDRTCALDAGVRFGLAGWNPRAVAAPGDLVLTRPQQVLDLLGV
jgi:phosphoglycolate phosphatase-like HAD superfamily hydrolase